jgi:hypothetical protein
VESVSLIHVTDDKVMTKLIDTLACVSYGLGDVVGIDTETVGCDPSKESPVGTARLWCTTLAWRSATGRSTAFVPRRFTYRLAGWLESPGAKKVGTNIYGYESHVFRNMGIELRGIHGDTVDMSRLIDPREMIDEHGGHGLKPWGKRMGFDVVEYKQLFRRRKPGRLAYYKRDSVTVKDGVTVHHVANAEHQILLKQWETMPIDEAWKLYPQRREQIIKYAVQDAEMSLEAFMLLRQRLYEVTF